jgi:ubiquitin carboxyl-terminal hydrolase 2/21
MDVDYLIFDYSHKKDNKVYFGKDLEIQPFIKDGKLYFPKVLKISQHNIIKNENQNDRQIYKGENKILYELSLKQPVGLVNIGGVCYMNALLQCFYYCFPMTSYFLSLDKNSQKDLGILSRGYYDFVNLLFSGNIYAAQNFKKAMIETDNSLFGNEGKDSKDLAILILSEIHQELKKNCSMLYDDKIESNPYDKLSVYKEKLSLDNLNNNSTIISKTFFFDILYEQECESKYNCDYNILSFDIQSDNIIVFELEKIYNKLKKRTSSYPYISLEDCLKNYNKEEIINCPFCKTKSLKMKKSICTLPNIFVFVMSRGKNAQFKCKIKFEKEIDVNHMNYFYQPISNQFKTYNTKYELIGATFAFDWYKGNGHTVAFCKTYRNEEYYVFNDSSSRKTDISEIKDKTPYILFYKRKNK